ncbi:MAG: SDR family NAD(P)-dependent oxidoreductase [Candidatus Nanopelagicales bacterium]
MRLDLEGQRVLVTGGASGIGRATALAFVAEGARVVVADHDAAGLAALAQDASDGQLVPVEADLAADAGCREAVASAHAALGGIDTLVNNVGVGSVRVFDDISDEEWLRTINLNFMSYVRTCRAALPALRLSGRHASIVNNASDLAKQPESNPIDYSASKAAVLALSKGLARSEGPSVRVNAVAPGPIWTPFWTKPGGFAETLGQVHGMEPMAAVEHEMSLRQLPMGRLGTPEEVAGIIVFLASPRAAFVTGSVWSVDGGSVRSLF